LIKIKKISRQKFLSWFILLIIMTISCLLILDNNLEISAKERIFDPLPSWNDGKTKQKIIKFVENVSKSDGIPIKDRIAVFDYDGTLLPEKPMYVQLDFLLETLLTEPNSSSKGLVDGENLIKSGFLAYTGMTQPEYEEKVKEFLTTAQHPRFKKPYTELIYQPMVELVKYLKLNDFQVYICSGSDIDFVRILANLTYGIPPENVIGTAIEKTFEISPQGVNLVRQSKLIEPLNDKAGKPVNINRYIGKIPVMAVGNSDGDIPMLQYTSSNPQANLELLLHHDDIQREYDYNQGAEKALILAKENNWTIITMKEDFKQVFPFQN